MSYTIKVYPEVQAAIANLPPAGRTALAEPTHSRPQHDIRTTDTAAG